MAKFQTVEEMLVDVMVSVNRKSGCLDALERAEKELKEKIDGEFDPIDVSLFDSDPEPGKHTYRVRFEVQLV